MPDDFAISSYEGVTSRIPPCKIPIPLNGRSTSEGGMRSVIGSTLALNTMNLLRNLYDNMVVSHPHSSGTLKSEICTVSLCRDFL